MNFYNEDENEKKEGAPALPRAASPFKKTSAFGKTPLFSRTAGSLMDRLKNLSRRDMALVSLGIGILVTVPVAEYMMSQPPKENLLEGGWGGKEKLGDMPYEPGVNGLSQGSVDGSGEVITPLASRDPVSLILGSQPAQPAVSAPVYTPPTTSMRDAMRDAGREAFTAASKNAGAPTVIPKMAGGLRNMSFFGGGESSRTSGNLGGGKIIDEARSASAKAAKRSMVGPVAIAGYKGVASTPNSASKGAFEKLRAAADKSAGNFSGGSAIRSLDKAAADALDIGRGAGGMGAGGDSDKTGKTSNNSVKGYEHNRSGQSLAEKAAEMRQQKALEWEFYKKYEIPKQIINAVVGAVGTTLGKFISSTMEDALGMSSPPPKAKYCWVPAGGYVLKGSASQPNSADTEACKTNGATKSGVVVLAAGKESSAAGQLLYCPCGYANEPIIGKNNDASTSDSSASKPIGDQAAAAQSGFDDIIRNIITETARVEKDTDNAKKLGEGLRNISAHFDKFASQKTASLTSLHQKKQAARTELGKYSGKIDEAQGQYDSTAGKHGTFSAQVDTLSAAIKPTGTGDAATYDCSGVTTTGDTGKKAVLAPETCKKIATDIAKWKDASTKALEAAQVKIAAHRKSYGEYERQIGFVDSHITNIETMYDGITELYQKAPALDNAENPNLEKAVARMKALTGRPEKEGETLAPGTIALKQATDLRALDWKVVWEKEHKFDNTGAEKAEATAWATQQANISTGKATEDTSAENMISNHMRSANIASSMSGRYSDLALIKGDVEGIEAAMNRFKSDLIAQKIDGGAYFPAGGAKPDKPSTEEGGDAGGKPDPVPQQTAKLSPEVQLSRDNLVSELNGTNSTYQEAEIKMGGMPEAKPGTPYAQRRANVEQRAQDLKDKKAALDKANAELAAATTGDDVVKKSAAARDARTAYSNAERSFNNAYDRAMKVGNGMVASGTDMRAIKASAGSDHDTLGRCATAATGLRGKAGLCSYDQATALRESFAGSAKALRDTVMEADSVDMAVSDASQRLRGMRVFACDVIKQCKNETLQGCQ